MGEIRYLRPYTGNKRDTHNELRRGAFSDCRVDRTLKGIVPQQIKHEFRNSAFLLQWAESYSAIAPGFIDADVEDDQLRTRLLQYNFPGLAAAPHPRLNGFLMSLFARQGRGMRLLPLLYMEALLSIPVTARTGEPCRIGGRDTPLTVREIVRDWLGPPTHAGQRLRQYRATGLTGVALRESFRAFNSVAVPINDHGGLWFPLWHAGQQGWRLDDEVILYGLIREKGRFGPMINRRCLRLLSHRPRFYRAYLALCLGFDRWGTSRGRKVAGRKREPQRLIKPWLDEDGQPTNPARSRYPGLGMDDLVRIVHPAARKIGPVLKHRMWQIARDVVRGLEHERIIVIERLGASGTQHRLPWRLMPGEMHYGADEGEQAEESTSPASAQEGS